MEFIALIIAVIALINSTGRQKDRERMEAFYLNSLHVVELQARSLAERVDILEGELYDLKKRDKDFTYDGP